MTLSHQDQPPSYNSFLYGQKKLYNRFWKLRVTLGELLLLEDVDTELDAQGSAATLKKSHYLHIAEQNK